MGLISADRVVETTTTTGTGALTLAGASTGYRAFSSVCTTDDTLYYAIEAIDSSGVPTGDWETGLGTYSGANTLTRTTVIASSNSNAAVSLAAGTKRVMLVLSGVRVPLSPTIVQQATGRSAASGSTTVVVTFGANTTPGNCVAVLVSGYGTTGSGGVITISGQTPTTVVHRGDIDGNQQLAALVLVVGTAATAYTVNIGSPNGGENVLALELSGMSHFQMNAYLPPTSGANITCPVFGVRGALNILMIETDTNTGGLTGSVSGLTTLYDAFSGGVNHAGVFFQVSDAALGTVKTITMTSTAGTTVAGTAIFHG